MAKGLVDLKREDIQSTAGYGIPCLYTLESGQRAVVLVSHGFGSNKTSSTARALERTMPGCGAGVVAYDFPGHGDSPVGGEMLTVQRCLEDLHAVERFVRTLAPQAEICYFSSSFGAYITLLYLSLCEHAGSRAFLRSAAVEMPRVFGPATPQQQEQMARQGYIEFGAQYEYERPLHLTRAFFESLQAHDVFTCWKPGAGRVCMIHGDADTVASYEAAQQFARLSGAEFITVPGGDHRLSGPGMPETVMRSAARFFFG